MGNHASITHSLHDIGFRVRVDKDPAKLNQADVLILPGVGAYPVAMDALKERDLVVYLQEQARTQRPLIGICLGMQLLASVSYEHGRTAGLDLIPGEVVPFSNGRGHIGWNTLKCVQSDPLVESSDGQAFYFNHSFYYEGPAKYQLAVAAHTSSFSAVIRSGNTVGVQFHPEKSQEAGKTLLKNIIDGLVHA